MVAMMKLTGNPKRDILPILQAVAKYTGKTVSSILIEPDPSVPLVYAVRAMLKTGRKTADMAEFLLRADGELEECEFSTWPPESARAVANRAIEEALAGGSVVSMEPMSSKKSS
jgi:hypothetical protein